MLKLGTIRKKLLTSCMLYFHIIALPYTALNQRKRCKPTYTCIILNEKSCHKQLPQEIYLVHSVPCQHLGWCQRSALSVFSSLLIRASDSQVLQHPYFSLKLKLNMLVEPTVVVLGHRADSKSDLVGPVPSRKPPCYCPSKDWERNINHKNYIKKVSNLLSCAWTHERLKPDTQSFMSHIAESKFFHIISFHISIPKLSNLHFLWWRKVRKLKNAQRKGTLFQSSGSAVCTDSGAYQNGRKFAGILQKFRCTLDLFCRKCTTDEPQAVGKPLEPAEAIKLFPSAFHFENLDSCRSEYILDNKLVRRWDKKITFMLNIFFKNICVKVCTVLTNTK